jgi:hypothetical protein
MKRYIMTFALFAIVLAALIGAPALPSTQVKIQLTTKVPEYLIQGFIIDSEDGEIVESHQVGDAFNPSGATFTYAVRTNMAVPLKISTEVTPFSSGSGGTVNIDQVTVTPTTGSFEVSPSVSGDGYKVVEFLFTPSISGMATYSYLMTVLADQEEVSIAPMGDYEATVSIGISAET